MTTPPVGKIYFKGLNGIRTIAALIVVVIHTGQYLELFGLQSSEYYKWHWQSYAVTLFFVLSGYLITYLLLEEKVRTNTVSLQGFYMRRILRIWPLYYLIIIITVGLHLFFPSTGIPQIPATPLALYAFLLANFALILGTTITPLTSLWSIGVEEQFYALWPIIIKKSTNVVRALWIIIIVYLVIKAAVIPLGSKQISSLVAETRIDCMAIGGFGAVILRENGRILKLIYSQTSQILCWILFFYSTIYKPVHVMTSINHELYSVVFMIIIVNVSTNRATLVNLENPFFDFMGKISYGLYIWHMLIIFLLSRVLKPFIFNSWPSYAIVYAGVVLLTTITAYLSYLYYELPFLNVKEKFSVVLSQASKEPT